MSKDAVAASADPFVLIASGSPGDRSAAVHALASLVGGPTMSAALKPYLPELLSDADPDVRLFGCEIARGISPEEATPLLSALLLRETSANVCAAAVDVLAAIGGPEAKLALHACADRFPDTFLAFAIRIAAERIGAPSRDPRG